MKRVFIFPIWVKTVSTT